MSDTLRTGSRSNLSSGGPLDQKIVKKNCEFTSFELPNCIRTREKNVTLANSLESQVYWILIKKNSTKLIISIDLLPFHPTLQLFMSQLLLNKLLLHSLQLFLELLDFGLLGKELLLVLASLEFQVGRGDPTSRSAPGSNLSFFLDPGRRVGVKVDRFLIRAFAFTGFVA